MTPALQRPNYSLMAPGDEIPAGFALLFGPPPVLENEDVRQYWALCRAFRAEIKPTNALEWSWLRDVTDLTWDVRRNRRFKAAILALGARAVKGTSLESVKNNPHHSNLTKEEQAVLIALQAEMETNLMIAAGFASRLREFDCIDRLLASAEKRRIATIREIELYRKIVAARVKETSDKFIAQSENVPLAP